MYKPNHPAVGSRPGTLVFRDDAPPTVVKVIHYSDDRFDESTVTKKSLLADAHDDSCNTWIDVQGFGDPSMIEAIAETFELHPLLLEDIINAPQRPKSETYGDQLLIIVRMSDPSDPESVQLEQVAVVIGPHYVITFQELHGDVLDPVRERLRRGNGLIYQHGVDYLGYAVIDTIMDSFFPVLESIGDHLEKLEDAVILNPETKLLGELNQWKNRLGNLRRIIWPHREAVNSLVRGDHPVITEPVRLFLRDTHDHCTQTSEVTEMYRDMVTNLMNTYLTAIANKTNEVMRVLTIVATIFIPITFLAGIYGMNFEYMPELHYKYAYPIFWAATGAVTTGMLGYFWLKGWIGPSA